MSNARVVEKFRVLAGEVLPAGHLDQALDLLWRFAEVSEVRQVFPGCSGRHRSHAQVVMTKEAPWSD